MKYHHFNGGDWRSKSLAPMLMFSTMLNGFYFANCVLAVRCYQIDFSNHLRCKIKVTDSGIEVESAMNGWGDGVPLSEVVVVEVQ